MFSNYQEMFKSILKAYYEDKLEEKLQQMLNEPGVDKVKLSKEISSLCGVQVEYSNNFICDLKHALENYTPSNTVINRITECPIECIKSSGKTSCEAICAFGAISVDKTHNLVTINEDKCISCGFCIEACQNKVLLDRIEFLPLIHILNKRIC